MTEASPEVEPIQNAAALLIGVLRQLGRDDLQTRIAAASARLARPSTVVCVVGEFKQGKSSLVNGLLGQSVCPVDDDFATAAITLVRYQEGPAAAVVRTGRGADAKAVKVDVNDVGEWVSEATNPGNERQVERVDIGIDSPILRHGLVIVDTPGMGGMGAGHAAATLAFLPFADGLVFVSDASAELSAPELAFLAEAQELCPTVLIAQTKTDLYPSWRKIVARNEAHLAAHATDVSIVALSNHLRSEALHRKDRALNDSSGYPELLTGLGTKVVEPAKAEAADRSRSDVERVGQQVRAGLAQELAILDDPTKMQAMLQSLEEAKTRLDHLRGPGARWSVLVGDRCSDLSNDVTFSFRAAIRTANHDIDERIEQLNTAQQWDELARDLQTVVAEAVTDSFLALERGRSEMREAVIELLHDEHLSDQHEAAFGSELDVRGLWSVKPVGEQGVRAGRAFKTGVSGLRGAQSGMYLLGVLTQWMPAAAAVVVGSNPVLLGAGALFGGMQLFDDRKRKVTTRRQLARTQVRQFLDDVQFEVGNEMASVLRNLQREMRDEFTDRINELLRTYTDIGREAQEGAKRTDEENRARRAAVVGMMGVLDSLAGVLDGVAPTGPSAQ